MISLEEEFCRIVRGAIYGGTKWFVRDFMEVLRMESAQEGTNIRTATIYPAAINTELLGQITDQDAAEKMTALYENMASHPIALPMLWRLRSTSQKTQT